jgi:hypothetical protein
MTLNPMDWSENAWQIFFALMAVWNLVVALPGLVAPRRGFRLLYGADTDRFYEYFQHWSISVVVLLFGVGYGIVAIAPSANLGLVLLGFIGKVFFAATMTTLYFKWRATMVALITAVADGVFAVFFLLYLNASVFFVKSLGG